MERASPLPAAATDLDAAAAAAALEAMAQVSIACDGLCASNEMRQAADSPLFCVSQLLSTKPPHGMHFVFARAAGLTDSQGGGRAVDGLVSVGAEFAALVSMWDTLKLEKVLQGKGMAGPGYRPKFITALASMRCSPETVERLDARLRLLNRPGVVVSGRALVGVPRLPTHLRGVVISHLHVLARLRGDQFELNTPDELMSYMDERCKGLLSRLHEEWYEEDEGEAGRPGPLRAEYLPASRPGRLGKAINK